MAKLPMVPVNRVRIWLKLNALANMNPMPLVYMICMAMFMSGLKIVGMLTTKAQLAMGHLEKMGIVNFAS